MKSTFLVIILSAILVLQSCNNPSVEKEVVNKPDSSGNDREEIHKPSAIQTHLKDTLTLNGNFILFLMPDSARFADLEEEEPGIYDADSDFGDGVTNTIDSFSRKDAYSNIKIHTTEKRFINIKDCNNCPIIIDRDTVNFGYIISGKDQIPETKFNEVHSGDYMQEIKGYFHL